METQECVKADLICCKECNVSKLPEEFYLSKGNRIKTCKVCCRRKERESYSINKGTRLARQKISRELNKERIKENSARWYLRNREKVLKASKAYRSKPEVRERELARQKKYYADRKTEIQAKRRERLTEARKIGLRQYSHEHYLNNREYYYEKCSKRRAKSNKATPQWANLKAIKEIYKMARELTLKTGIKHHVDHIIPLNGEIVSGLHVEYNLQVITMRENLSKANKLKA